MRRLAALAVLALAACQPVSREGGIVSTNPCLDAILIELVPDERIGAISHYSHDPAASSVDVAWTQHLPAINGTAEEVIARKPTLVLLGSHTPLATRDAIEASGIRTAYFDVPASIAESKAQIRQMARVVGEPRRGEALVTRIDAAIARAGGRNGVPALIWQDSGLVPGDGTLADDLLRHAGFYNAAKAYQLASWDVLPLERLAATPPRVVLTPPARPGASALATRDRLLRHWGRRVTRADFDEKLLFCGGPTIPRALDRLREVREGISPRPAAGGDI